MDGLSSSLAILSAMLTPAVLISACGALTISTSNRLSRAITRAHTLRDRIRATGGQDPRVLEHVRERERTVLLHLLARVTRRARLLQRAMSYLYMAIGVFVATSVTIGVTAFVGGRYAWLPIVIGLAGVGLLFHACSLLIIESRVMLTAIDEEMDLVEAQRENASPGELHPPE